MTLFELFLNILLPCVELWGLYGTPYAILHQTSKKLHHLITYYLSI